jgi:hypothetical protein
MVKDYQIEYLAWGGSAKGQAPRKDRERHRAYLSRQTTRAYGSSSGTSSKYSFIKKILWDFVRVHGLNGIKASNLMQVLGSIGQGFKLIFVGGSYDHMENISRSIGIDNILFLNSSQQVPDAIADLPKFILFLNCGQHYNPEIVEQIAKAADEGRLLQIVTTDWMLRELMNNFTPEYTGSRDIVQTSGSNVFAEVEGEPGVFFVQQSNRWWFEPSSYLIPPTYIDYLIQNMNGRVILKVIADSPQDHNITTGMPIGMEFIFHGIPIIHFVSHLEMQHAEEGDETLEELSQQWGTSPETIGELISKGVSLAEIKTMLISAASFLSLIFYGVGREHIDPDYTTQAIALRPEMPLADMERPQLLITLFADAFSLLSGVSLEHSLSNVSQGAQLLMTQTRSPVIGAALARVLRNANNKTGPRRILIEMVKLYLTGVIEQSNLDMMKRILNPINGLIFITLEDAVEMFKAIDPTCTRLPSFLAKLFDSYFREGTNAENPKGWTPEYVSRNLPSKYLGAGKEMSDRYVLQQIVKLAKAPRGEQQIKNMTIWKRLLSGHGKAPIAKVAIDAAASSASASTESIEDMLSRVTDINQRLVLLTEMLKAGQISVMQLLKNLRVIALIKDYQNALPAIEELLTSPSTLRIRPILYIKAIMGLVNAAQALGIDYLGVTKRLRIGPGSIEDPSFSSECVVCMTNQANSLSMSCGHCVTCEGCMHELQQRGQNCPVCRAPIEETRTGFFRDFVTQALRASLGDEAFAQPDMYLPEMLDGIINLLYSASIRAAKYLVGKRPEGKINLVVDRSPQINLINDPMSLMVLAMTLLYGWGNENINLYFLNGNKLKRKQTIGFEDFAGTDAEPNFTIITPEQISTKLELQANENLIFMTAAIEEQILVFNEVAVQKPDVQVTIFDGQAAVLKGCRLNMVPNFKIIPGLDVISIKQLNPKTDLKSSIFKIYQALGVDPIVELGEATANVLISPQPQVMLCDREGEPQIEEVVEQGGKGLKDNTYKSKYYKYKMKYLNLKKIKYETY